MQEEPDTCRICSAPAEPDQPLFHPCKCSGTIRYIHQDCLTEWLAHSKKKTCDVCKYPYSFTKVYSKDMPERLPILLVLRQFSRQFLFAILFGLRTALVALIWLAALPWATIWTWRMYFAMGNHAAWWISALKRPEHEPDLFDELTSVNVTTIQANTTSDTHAPVPYGFLSHPLVLQVSSDIVTGQIIASMIVIAFVAIFLLREWITQNARPGIFEDEDGPIDAGAPDLPNPVPEIAPPVPEVVVQPPPARAIPPTLRDARGRPYAVLHQEDNIGPRGKTKKPRTRADATAVDSNASDSDDIPEAGPSRSRRRRSGEHTSGRDCLKGKSPAAHRTSRASRKARLRRREDGNTSEDRLHAQNIQKHREFQRLRYVRGRPAPDAHSEPGPSNHREPRWPPERRRNRDPNALPAFSEFTFTVPARSTSAGPARSDRAALPEESGTPPRANGYGEPPARNPFSPPPPPSYPDSSTEEDERDATPTSPTAPVAGPSDPATLDIGVNFNEAPDNSSPAQPSPSPSTSVPSGLRRPPLPTVTLPPSPALASASTSAVSSRKPTPLASPSLATYRAPEDLHPADQNGEADYFVEKWYADLIDEEDLEEAQRKYFRDPEETQREVDQAERDAEAERVEREEMADAEVEGEGDADDDGADDVRWTDEEVVIEEDDEDDEEGAGREVVVDRQEVGVGADGPEAGAVQRVEPPPPPPEDFENDLNIEDDMDGALEAIGLRGPLYGVLQNAILMTFILDTTIGLGIWLPFTIGKSTALLTLNPRRALQILHSPLRVIRIVTDPVVDTAFLVVSKLVLPPLVALGRVAATRFLSAVVSFAGPEQADKLSGASASVYSRFMQAATRVVAGPASPAPSQHFVAPPSTSYLYQLLEEDTTVMRVIEPYFAPLGENIRQWSTRGKEAWIEMAMGDERQDRVFAVALGYAVVGLLLAVYLNVLTVGTMRSAGRAVRSAIRQQLLVVKVAAFIVIELIIFPLGCGMMLDICSVWMFPHGTFRSRAAFLLFAPMRATFYHWVLGTMFMYQFAVLLSGCRGIMRPGAMWFIKDPQDQNFHPIRDILERPTLVQLRKLLLSAAMYGVVVASGVATISSILRLFRGTIMPFRWKLREPLSEVPIDLIFIQLVLPYTMDYFRPRKALRRFGTFIWKYLAKQLRLSSYMFGGRYPSEEYSSTRWSWRSLLHSPNDIEMDDAEAEHDGTFRRVPNSDNVALVKDLPATVEVTEEGYPLDAEGLKILKAQDVEAERAKRLVKDDYVVVYIPPHFRYRVMVFLLCIWVIGSMMLATTLAAPILLGRGFFRLFLPYDVHDGYSFIVGFYLLWGCWLVGTALDRMDKRRQRRWSDGARAEWPLFVAKRSLLWVAQASYMLAALGVVLPTLLGLVVELYIIQPIKHVANPGVEPRIRMVDMWALGLLYSKIIVRSMRMNQPGHDMMRGVERLMRNGWTHLDPIRATTEVIGPVTAGLLGMIIMPAAALWAASRLIDLPMDADFLCTFSPHPHLPTGCANMRHTTVVHVYPGLFTLAGLGHAAWVLSRVMRSWSQTIRDKEFLVEMRLRNLEEQEKADRTLEQDASGAEVLVE
ncbi:hypothetical protein BD413DRAFT_700194 [Trametes elegans]|nr:hypothetical protein BD413DRAFT_700194 [Trametes elegans]